MYNKKKKEKEIYLFGYYWFFWEIRFHHVWKLIFQVSNPWIEVCQDGNEYGENPGDDHHQSNPSSCSRPYDIPNTRG